MRKLIKGLAALAILCLGILLTGSWGEAEAPTLDKAVIQTPSPTPTATPTSVPTQEPRLAIKAKATPKPVIVYVKKSTPAPAATASGAVVRDCIIDAFNPDTQADRNRLTAGASFTSPPCDYGFLLCLSDRTNCSGTVAECHKKYENGEICESMPPEIPFNE